MSHKKDDHSDDIFDEKLRDMMQKSKPPLPPGFQKEIEDLVDQLCEKEQEHQPRFRIRFVKAVVIPLICILVVCGSCLLSTSLYCFSAVFFPIWYMRHRTAFPHS